MIRRALARTLRDVADRLDPRPAPTGNATTGNVQVTHVWVTHYTPAPIPIPAVGWKPQITYTSGGVYDNPN